MSSGQASGNGGRVCAPVSAEFSKKRSRSIKFQSVSMESGEITPRLVEPRLVEALEDSHASGKF